jgi:16S rRNA (guanine(1405)-N(7))-methyltransferase
MLLKADKLNRENHIDLLVEAVLKSPKYKNVCQDLIKNIGIRELSKKPILSAAIKSTKNKLHQIGGAYFLRKPDYALWLKRLKDAKESGNERLFRRTCVEIMGYHYSTKQRLNILGEFYAKIFSLLPHIHSIMDVACGFHPLAIPWMPIAENVNYYAYDIYNDLTDFLNDFMVIASVQGYAEYKDILQSTPKIKTDLAFLLNALPCLEQVEKSASSRILESINADFVAVSFPVQSLGGRKKDMRSHYAASFERLRHERKWVVQELGFETELVFLITKNR